MRRVGTGNKDVRGWSRCGVGRRGTSGRRHKFGIAATKEGLTDQFSSWANWVFPVSGLFVAHVFEGEEGAGTGNKEGRHTGR